MSKPAIGFCGLGAMGFGMATYLVKQGYSVTGFDVYPPTLQRFKDAGGIPSTSLSESATDKSFYICMVATAQQAQTALFADGTDGDAIVKGLPKGATLLLTSTVPSAYAQSVEKTLKDVGRDDILFIDCPVSGGAGRAADGTLSIMAGAPDAAMEKGKWLLEELSDTNKLFIVKGGVGAGSNMKMVHQVLAAIQILSTSEAFGFAAHLGLDANEVKEKVLASEAWAWMFEHRSTRVINEDWRPGVSALTIILKDTGIITSTSRLQSFPTPLCTAAEQVYLAGLALGYGSLDDAGLVRMYYPSPVAEVKSALSPEEKSTRIDLVIALLKAIHLCAAAESIAFAQHVGLPLDQLYTLAVDAAGGSTMFKAFGPKMIGLLKGEKAEVEKGLDEFKTGLRNAVDEAQRLRCPLYLGSAALNLMGLAESEWVGAKNAEDLVRLWVTRRV